MSNARGFLVLGGWVAGLLTAAITLLLTTGPVLSAAGRVTGPDAVVAAAAALAAWLVLGWLALGLALTLGELVVSGRRRTPHAQGEHDAGACRALAVIIASMALAPLRDAVRSSLRLSTVGLVGGTVAVAAVTPTAAWATAQPDGPGASRASAHVRLTDRAVPPEWPSLDRPAQPVSTPVVAPPTAAGRGPSPSPAASTYRVETGDTLWSIAAAHLPDRATDQQIALAWPRWWHANRAVIGPDPGLIRPGQHLVVPGTRS